MDGYWQKLLDKRLSRRRALAATGATAAGAALLAACGGGGESGTTVEDTSGLVTPYVDETKQAIRGGTLKSRASFEIVHMDPQVTGNHTGPAPAFFSTVVRIADGYLQDPDGEIEGDVLESWEISADKLTITAKVSPGAHFAPLAPVNGRAVDAADVVYSWNRFLNIGTRRGEYANSIAPDSPIVSVTNPDNRTVVIKLSAPNATVFSLLAQTNPGTFFVVPKESADEKVLDLRTNPIGSGPWYLSEWAPGIGYKQTKNPGFKQDKRGDIPILAEIENPTIQEYAVVLSQFRAGALYSGSVRAEDVLPTKRDIPELVMRQGDLDSAYMRTFFGHLPVSPFKDERVRLAWQWTYDRELFVDVFYNVAPLRAEGLPVETSIDAALHAEAYRGWPLDPRDTKTFGPNAKYFVPNIAEAKKLLEAAGFPNGVDTVVHYPASGPGSGYPADWFKKSEIILGMVRDSQLFRFEIDQVNYNTEWTPRFRNIRGQFDSVAMILDTATPDPTNYMFTRFNSAGALYQGSDSVLEDLTKRSISEFDTKKRQDMVHEMQRHEAGKMFFPLLGGASGFSLHWPVLRNGGVYQGGSGRSSCWTWLDPNQPPLKRA
jgi:ABC-type transport system substrate-binding protein